MSSMRCSRSRDAGQTNVHHIGGIPVQFPYQPYGSQLAFMGRVISTLDRAVRDGHSNAVLESPTGTGKTLSLLCSSLAWQENYKSRLQTSGVRFSDPASVDPLIDGGGFVPESQPLTSDPANKKTAKKKKTAPTVFYASRTHSQITQVIREYRKTAYRVPMAVLGSRKHYCTNARARGKENIDEECRSLLDRGGGGDSGGCAEFKNYGKIKSHPSIQNGGGVHDIEDLVRIGESVRGCPYYASCSMAETAELIFCPYSYVINPIVRRAMNIDLRGSVLILDEAHNVEDTVRDSGSVEIEEGVMRRLQTELELLSLANPVLYQPLLESVQGITGWMDMRRTGLEKREFQNYSSSWTGDRAVRELEEAHISMTYFEIVKECASKAIREASDPDYSDPDRAVSNSGGARLTGLSATVLEELFSSLCYFFLHSCDYQLALQHSVKSSSLVYTFSLWCLNPAVVFGGIADVSLSVILTSGTLSPMNSFSSELGIPFAATLEAPHVIDVESQVWASVITSGPGNYPLNASYRTADRYEFQDELGSSLEQIFVVVPGGCLVFFPSYKLMEKMCVRWRSTGQWSRLDFRKAVFVESRSGTQDELESTLQSYYRCCSRKPRKRANKIGDDDGDGALRLPKGAAFLAVCRGKISEGIDFSDDHARAVIVVGIPFPNVHDLQVLQKKRYNDMFKASKNLLSGNEWYCHQAFRALNQAAGRCIRHRFDHGAVILMDERFREERNTAYVSKWLRNSIVRYDRFDKSLESLRAFFDGVKERIGKRMANCSPSIASRSVNRKKSASAIENQKLLRRLPPSLDFSSSPEDECDVGDESGEYSAVLNNPAASDDRIRSSSLATVEFSICRTPVVNRNASPGASDWTRNPVAGSVKSDADPASSFTPERNSTTTTTTAFPSVNSLAFKRRRPTCTDAIQPVQCLLDPGPGPDCDKENRELKPCVVLDKRLQIHCSVCRNPLGHSEGSQVRCSITAVSKGFLRDLRDEASSVLSGSPGTPVVMTDSSSVHARLVGGRNAGGAQCGVWREDDGCVFRAIYCPFCSTCDFCLGVQVMAADSANVHLLDKVVFFADRVQIKRPIPPKNDASS